MIKKVTKLILAIILLLTLPGMVYADGKAPKQNQKNGNFSKKSFSNKNQWSNNSKALTPPNPGDGGTGDPIPISGGMAFLLLGGTLYFFRRIRQDNND